MTLTPLAHVWHESSRPAAPALVLVHGWGLDSRVWQLLLPGLREHFRVLCIDLPGHGASPWQPGDEDFRQVCVRLLAVAPAQAMWLGWSLGGLLALAIAAQYPQRVSALTLLAASPCFVAREAPSSAISPIPAMPASDFAGFAQGLAESPEKTRSRFLALCCHGGAQARADRLAVQALAAPAPATVALQAGLHWLETEDWCEAYAAMSLPLHLVLGEKDALVPATLAAWSAQVQPLAHVDVLPGAAHLPLLSHPQALLTTLLGRLLANRQTQGVWR
ncbi:MAG: alpha/beta fold hydrolase [Moraxellaceae bacterium]|nr:alpha/beta fold hydrolase [Moraxellaceae bacterium]